MADDLYQIDSGLKQDIPFTCAAGNKCWVKKALKLQEKYFTALKALNTESSRWKVKLENAQFLSQVTKAAAKADGIDADDVWGNMRPQKGGSGDPGKYEDTRLCEDIKGIEKNIKDRRNNVEKTAEDLISCLKKKGFQRHILDHHSQHQISPNIAAEVYGAVLKPFSSGDKILFREIDHYMALLTEHLAVTEKGRDFLTLVLKKDWVSKNIAFADVWGYTAKIKALSEPVGKFFYNVSPVIVARVQELINEKKIKDISDVLKDPDLKTHFKFLKEKLDFDIAKWLDKRANKFAGKASKARKYLESRSDWEKTIKQFQDVMDDGEAKTALKNAWVGITLDTVAFAISIVKIATDFKKAKLQDWMGLVSDFTGLVKTAAEVKQSQVLLISGKGQSYQSAKALTKRLGVLGGVVTIIIMCADVYEGIDGSDWDKVALNTAGIAVAGVGIYAAIIESAMLSGICTIVAIILAIITALVVDPKIIDYIEDTYWGEDYKDKKIPLRRTIHEYYKQMFKMRLRFVINELDNNESIIQIECGMLTDTIPVYMEIIRENGNKSLGRKRIYPKYSSVKGAGKINKDTASWSKHWPFYDKQLEIYYPWEIWTKEPGIARDNDTEHTIKVGMDLSNNAKKIGFDKMAQNAKITGLEFPKVQKPILWDASTKWDANPTYISDAPFRHNCLTYPASGEIKMKVVTEYATGCYVYIRALEDKVGPYNKPISSVTKKITAKKMYVPVKLDPPPADKRCYDLMAEVILKDKTNKKVIEKYTLSTFRIGYPDYVKKHKI